MGLINRSQLTCVACLAGEKLVGVVPVMAFRLAIYRNHVVHGRQVVIYEAHECLCTYVQVGAYFKAPEAFPSSDDIFQVR